MKRFEELDKRDVFDVEQDILKIFEEMKAQLSK